jgi:hypothetical protein
MLSAAGNLGRPVVFALWFGHLEQEAFGRDTMERSISMPLGVVVERRELDNRWQRFAWKPVAVIPGAAPVTEWRELMRGEGFVRWHAATLPLELHRKETEG